MNAAERIRPERRPAFSANREVGQRGAETHARLLEAGLRVLDSAGYHGTRVEAIAERAGCSRPTFYQYFADKADFFFHLAAQVDGEIAVLAADVPVVDTGRSSRNAIRDWLARFEALRTRHAAVFRFEALLRSDPRLARGSEERLLGVGRVVASAVELPRGARAPTVAHGVLVYTTIAQAFGALPRPLPRDRLIEGAADWFHRCFFGALRGVNAPDSSRRGNGRSGRSAARRPAQRTSSPPPALGRKAAQSRERLLAAARDVFGNLGFEGTRVDDIASAASLSHGAFYRYFAGKEDVFREVATPAVEDLLVLIEELPDPRGGLHAWARRLYQTDSIHRGLFSAWAESPLARAALPPELGLEIDAAIDAALRRRDVGDRQVDALLFLAHLERAPYIARIYSRLAQADAIAATGEILERGFFGAEGGGAAG